MVKETRDIDGHPLAVEYIYDGVAGRLSGRFCPQTGSFAGYRYDANGYLKSVNTDRETIWALTANTGTKTTAQWDNGTITASKTYDKYGFLADTKTTKGNAVLFGIQYEFNPWTGNLSRRKGINGHNEHFGYDDSDRLRNYSVFTPSGKLVSGASFEYQPNGNIEYKSNTGFYYYDSHKPHAVTSISKQLGEIPAETQEITYTPFNKAEKITEGNYELEIFYGPDQQRWKSTLKENGVVIKEIIFAPDYERYRTNPS